MSAPEGATSPPPSESEVRRMRHLGNAAHLLHIRPWEWRLMTVEETDIVHAWLDSYDEQMKEAEAEANSSR